MSGGGTSGTERNSRPAVYGYVRMDEMDGDVVASVRADLKRFCVSQGWRLVTVFCDRDCDGSAMARPGFAGVLDALALPDSTTLVVPSLEHLSPDEAVRAALTSMVRRAGAMVVVAAAPNEHRTLTEPPRT